MRGKKYIFVIVFVCLLITPLMVLANGGGVEFGLENLNAVIRPSKNSIVEIYREDLVYNIQQDYKMSDFYKPKAIVDVTYYMRNSDSRDEVTTIAFPFLRFNNENSLDFKVFFNNEEIPVQFLCSNANKKKIIKIKNGKTYIESLNFEQIIKHLDRDANIDHCGIVVGIFELIFPENSDNILNIKYIEHPYYLSEQFVYGYNTLPEINFSYLLEPASYWKDFKNLNITLKLNDYSLENINLDGFNKVDNNYYTAHFEELPEDNLSFDIIQSTLYIYRFSYYGSIIVIALLILMAFILMMNKVFSNEKPKSINLKLNIIGLALYLPLVIIAYYLNEVIITYVGEIIVVVSTLNLILGKDNGAKSALSIDIITILVFALMLVQIIKFLFYQFLIMFSFVTIPMYLFIIGYKMYKLKTHTP